MAPCLHLTSSTSLESLLSVMADFSDKRNPAVELSKSESGEGEDVAIGADEIAAIPKGTIDPVVSDQCAC